MITDQEYNLTQDRLITMASFVRTMDLDGFLSRLKVTQKAALILDPGIYSDFRDIEAIHDVAAAALEFKEKLIQVRAHWRQRNARRILKGELNG